MRLDRRINPAQLLRQFWAPGVLFMIWLVLILASADRSIRTAGFFSGMVLDPDSFMHLARHLDGNWLYNSGRTSMINAPFGAVVHWTWPYDVFLGALAAPLRWWGGLEPRPALALAGSWSSALATLIALGVLYRFGMRLRSPTGGLVLGVLYLTALPVLSYSSLGRADHHSLTLLLAIVFLTRLAEHARTTRPPKKRDLLCTGLWGGLGLWTAPEILPALGAGVGLWAAWHILHQRPLRKADSLIGGGMAALCLFVLVLDPPPDGRMSPDSDRLSVVFALFAALVGLVLLLAPHANRLSAQPMRRMLVVGGGAGLAGLLWLGLFPHALSGPIGHVTPLLQQKWLNFISEMQPIHNPARFFWYLTPGISGVVASLILAYRTRRENAHSLFYLLTALVVLAAVAGGALAARFCYFAALAGILPIMILWHDHVRTGLVGRIYLLLGIIALPALLGAGISKAAGFL